MHNCIHSTYVKRAFNINTCWFSQISITVSITVVFNIAPVISRSWWVDMSCLCNRILLPRQVAQVLSNLIFCNMLLRQNSWYAEIMIFTKILQYTRSDLSLRHVVATCCCNLLPSVYRPLRLTTLPGSTFPTLNEQQCGFLFVPQEYLLHVQWNPVNTDTKGINNDME